jgi:hypothetical protein
MEYDEVCRRCGMKQHRTVRILQMSVVLSLLVLSILPSAVLAAERSVRVFPDKVAEGGKVDVRGDGYAKDYPDVALRAGFPFVTVYLALEEAEVGERIGVDVKTYAIADASSKVDEFGKFSAGFLVPGELVDGAYVGDVEEGTYFVYVTYWNDDVIVAATVLEVVKVVDKFPFWPGRASPWYWSPYSGCRPYDYYYYGPPWDGIPHPFPWWGPPCVWSDDCCDECPDDWDDDCPLPWPPRPYRWSVIPLPPCGC